MIAVDLWDRQPISEQLVNSIRKQIQQGLLSPGDQLPTVRDLAFQLDINFNTVARAYQKLDEEGWIRTRQGRGTYVSPTLPATETAGMLHVKQSGSDKLTRLFQQFLQAAQDAGYTIEEINKVANTFNKQSFQRKARQPRRTARRIITVIQRGRSAPEKGQSPEARDAIAQYMTINRGKGLVKRTRLTRRSQGKKRCINQ